MKEWVINVTGVQFSYDIGKYLDFPILNKRAIKRDFQFIVDNINFRVFSWKNKFLNKASRLTLVQYVLGQSWSSTGEKLPSSFRTPEWSWSSPLSGCLGTSFAWAYLALGAGTDPNVIEMGQSPLERIFFLNNIVYWCYIRPYKFFYYLF